MYRFIIPREVHVDEVGAATPHVTVAVAPPHPHRATSPRPSDSSFEHTPKKPHKKKRKQASIL